MIRVTIELLPFGSEEGRKHLGTIEIANDGTGTVDCGNYMVRQAKAGARRQEWKRGVVKDFPRRLRGPYDLLFRALAATVGSRQRWLLQELEEECSTGSTSNDNPSQH
jgi:hypothetical protein